MRRRRPPTYRMPKSRFNVRPLYPGENAKDPAGAICNEISYTFVFLFDGLMLLELDTSSVFSV
jgi:hypothetical protein